MLLRILSETREYMESPILPPQLLKTQFIHNELRLFYFR